jgi:hypothetical protein
MSLCLRGEIFIKVSVLAFLFLASYLTSSAQISFGVKGGLNINYLIQRYEGRISETSQQSGYGFHLGAYSNIPFSKKFSVRPELQFSRRSSDYFFKLSYLELPLLVSYFPIKWIGIDLGPNLGYLLSYDTNSAFFNDDFKNFDFGLTGGLHFNLPKGFSVVTRYYFGLTSIRTIDLTNAYQCVNCDPVFQQGNLILDEYNRTIQFSIGYKIK